MEAIIVDGIWLLFDLDFHSGEGTNWVDFAFDWEMIGEESF
jgi:hypothetical protein